MAAAFASSAFAADVTPTDLQGWAPADVRPGGSVEITSTYKPAGETGSLEFNTTAYPGKAGYANNFGGVAATLGDFVAGSLSFDYFISSDSGTTNLAPVFRLAFEDGGKTGFLIWEQVYNGASFAEDTWHSYDIADGNFWMFQSGFGAVEQFSVTLADWAGGYSAGTGHEILSASALIKGIEIGVGSGWTGDFKGAVDHVDASFGGRSLSANFEVAAVPEPGTWALMITGFGLAGAALRRRSKAALAA